MSFQLFHSVDVEDIDELQKQTKMFFDQHFNSFDVISSLQINWTETWIISDAQINTHSLIQ